MSSIRIAKGYPKSFLIRLKSDDVIVNINDGTWTVTAELRYQTKNGAAPFTLTPVVSGSVQRVDLTNQQTSQLSHLGTGYILVTKFTKNDNSVFIENEVPVSVTDGL
jgi:hypothetical protein